MNDCDDELCVVNGCNEMCMCGKDDECVLLLYRERVWTSGNVEMGNVAPGRIELCQGRGISDYETGGRTVPSA